MARKRIFRTRAVKGPSRRIWRGLRLFWRRMPVRNGWLALLLLNLAVLVSGLESAYVQAVTTYQAITPELLTTPSFLFLLCLDLLFPLIVALLSRRAFFIYLIGQCFLSTILLHYTIFFYNPLTLSTIYHSMQGAASLGIDIFGFARPGIILSLGILLLFQLLLVQLSRAPERLMPRLWRLRGITAVCAMAVVFMVSSLIYGKTGLSMIWVDSIGHRTATERRQQGGTGEAVRNIGYLATWLGEWMSGTYRDTDLIYAERRCPDPDSAQATALYSGLSPDSEAAANETDLPGFVTGRSPQSGQCPPGGLNAIALELALQLPAGDFAIKPERPKAPGAAARWNGLPLPPAGDTVVLLQAESLDFAAIGTKVNGHAVLPFLDFLTQNSLLLRVFAPHKVGSSNSDYELLNGRVAEQNVIYYSYITEYPDSIIHLLKRRGYATSVFHGLGGGLFNLREAYRAQGFDRFYFKEELLEAGYKPGKYIMEHILDENVFELAAEKLAQERNRKPETAPEQLGLPENSPLTADMESGSEKDGKQDNNAAKNRERDPAVNTEERAPFLRPAIQTNKQAQFIVSMSSHIPFMDPNPLFKSAGGSFSRYVSSLRYLDQCLAAYYAMLPEGTLLIIWGDHGSDVTYPKGFAQNSRHVPFMLHVKGDSNWLEQWQADNEEPPVCLGGNIETDRAGERVTHGYELSTRFPRLASAREYRLCELHYYLRRIFE